MMKRRFGNKKKSLCECSACCWSILSMWSFKSKKIFFCMNKPKNPSCVHIRLARYNNNKIKLFIVCLQQFIYVYITWDKSRIIWEVCQNFILAYNRKFYSLVLFFFCHPTLFEKAEIKVRGFKLFGVYFNRRKTLKHVFS